MKLLAIVLAGLCVACSSDEGAGPAPTSSTSDAEYAARAGQVVAELAAGEYAKIREQFNAQMVESLSEDRLRQAWMGFEALYGEYASHGSATASNLGGFVVLNVPLAMANGPAKARISFQSDGKIAGLYLLRQDAP